MFINQLVASPLSKSPILTGAVSGLWLLCNILNVEFWWQSHWPVHQLWPPREDKRSTEMDVVLFHGLQLTANDNGDAWRGTWTQRGHDDVC